MIILDCDLKLSLIDSVTFMYSFALSGVIGLMLTLQKSSTNKIGSPALPASYGFPWGYPVLLHPGFTPAFFYGLGFGLLSFILFLFILSIQIFRIRGLQMRFSKLIFCWYLLEFKFQIIVIFARATSLEFDFKDIEFADGRRIYFCNEQIIFMSLFCC